MSTGTGTTTLAFLENIYSVLEILGCTVYTAPQNRRRHPQAVTILDSTVVASKFSIWIGEYNCWMEENYGIGGWGTIRCELHNL